MHVPCRFGERTGCRGFYGQLLARRKDSSSSVLSLSGVVPRSGCLRPWEQFGRFTPILPLQGQRGEAGKRFVGSGSERICPLWVVSEILSIETPSVRLATALFPWDRLPPALSIKVHPFSFAYLPRVNTGLSPCIPSPKSKVIWLGGLFCAFFQFSNAPLHNLNAAHAIFHTVLIQIDV